MSTRMAGLGLALSAIWLFGGSPVQAAPRTQLNEQEMLDRFDIDGDGTLSAGEKAVARGVLQIMRREGSLDASADKVQKAIKRFDANDDNQISTTELTAMLAAARRQYQTNRSVNGDLRETTRAGQFDTNGDGQIDATELAVAQAAMANQASSALQLRAAMSQLGATATTPVDTDGDGIPDAGTGTGAGGAGCQPTDGTTDTSTTTTATSSTAAAARAAARASRAAQSNVAAQMNMQQQQMRAAAMSAQGFAGRSALAGSNAMGAAFGGRGMGMAGGRR